jgi:Leu/Phe-tRNA-protein transferase
VIDIDTNVYTEKILHKAAYSVETYQAAQISYLLGIKVKNLFAADSIWQVTSSKNQHLQEGR